jgi:hypothetical protein
MKNRFTKSIGDPATVPVMYSNLCIDLDGCVAMLSEARLNPSQLEELTDGTAAARRRTATR